MQLVIGNKNHSSWSLRPWLLLHQAGIPFEEIRVPLYQAGTKSQLARYSTWTRVPILIDGPVTVWESLAICEYLAERHADKNLWPTDIRARAMARSVSAEMHAGFSTLRHELSMDCRAYHPGFPVSAGARNDLDRIETLWSECRTQFASAGPFLFGAFSVADAMYAPIALRVRTYDVNIKPESADYVSALLALPAMQAWIDSARDEPERLPQFERLPV